MATLEQLERALIAADKAGATEDARVFAAEIVRMRGATNPIKQSGPWEKYGPPPTDRPASVATRKYRVTSPDGRAFEVTAPEGATQQQVLEYAKAQTSEQGPWTKYQAQKPSEIDVRLPDGTIIKNVPEGTTKADLTAKLKANGMDVSGLEAASRQAPKSQGRWQDAPILHPAWASAPEVGTRGPRSEQEEFEFRHRLEQERGTKPRASINPSTVTWDKPIDPRTITWDDAKKDEPFPVKLGRQMLNAGAGAIRGAGSIGATILAPIDAAARAVGIENSFIGRKDRRAAMTGALGTLGADTESLAFAGGKLGAEVAGTLGAGSAVALPIRAAATALPKAAPALNALANATAAGGFKTGSALPPAQNMLTRMTGGALAGGASAGLIDPGSADLGAGIGATLPPGLKLAGKVGSAAATSLRGGGASPEVASLARRARELGIDIPADRLVDSRPLNALASGLNYVPFSGRSATEARMEKQLTKAASRLIGQDSDNMALALRKASDDLGAKFDATLKSTAVNFDKQLLDESAQVLNTAQKELGSDALKAISSQVDELVAKGQSGVIDGQAAYNIKRTLDRIGRGNGPEAFHALELKRVLMGALDRSLGPDGAKAFAKTRQQYGNMLALEKIARNGVEGDISVAKLANMQNINNAELQEIADIAAQFVKAREGAHGSMQRGAAALGIGGTLGLPGLAATAAAGRGTNMLLNSNATRNLLMQQPGVNALAMDPVQQLLYRSAPPGASR